MPSPQLGPAPPPSAPVASPRAGFGRSSILLRSLASPRAMGGGPSDARTRGGRADPCLAAFAGYVIPRADAVREINKYINKYIYIYIYMYSKREICAYIYIYIHIHIHRCIHVYVYISTYTYIYIYIYMYIERER